VLLGEGHVGEDVRLGLVEERGELGQLGPDLVGDLAPLRLGGIGGVLGEGGGDERPTTRRPLLPAWARALRMKCTRQEHAGDRGLDAFVRIRDHQLDPGPTAALELAQELDPEGDAPIAMPTTSRRPSVLTATAMVTATDTMRPASRTFT
jgi:hypothetical protein